MNLIEQARKDWKVDVLNFYEFVSDVWPQFTTDERLLLVASVPELHSWPTSISGCTFWESDCERFTFSVCKPSPQDENQLVLL